MQAACHLQRVENMGVHLQESRRTFGKVTNVQQTCYGELRTEWERTLPEGKNEESGAGRRRAEGRYYLALSRRWVASGHICRCRAAGSYIPASGVEFRVSRLHRKVRICAHGSWREQLRSSALHDPLRPKTHLATGESRLIRVSANSHQRQRSRFHRGRRHVPRRSAIRECYRANGSSLADPACACGYGECFAGLLAKRPTKYSTSNGISSTRSRSGGKSIGTTFNLLKRS